MSTHDKPRPLSCEEFRRLMADESGNLDAPTIDRAIAHLNGCQQCTREAAQAEKVFDAAWSRIPMSEAHLSEDDLAVLGEYSAGPLPGEMLGRLKHAIVCEDCRAALTAVRDALHGTPPPDLPELELDLDAFWKNVQEEERALTAIWLGAALTLSTSALAAARARRYRNGSEIPVLSAEAKFDRYTVEIRLIREPTRAARKIELRILSAEDGASIEGLLVKLSARGEVVQVVPVTGGVARLPAQEPGAYQLSLEHEDGKIIHTLQLDLDDRG